MGNSGLRATYVLSTLCAMMADNRKTTNSQHFSIIIIIIIIIFFPDPFQLGATRTVYTAPLWPDAPSSSIASDVPLNKQRECVCIWFPLFISLCTYQHIRGVLPLLLGLSILVSIPVSPVPWSMGTALWLYSVLKRELLPQASYHDTECDASRANPNESVWVRRRAIR